MEKIIKYLEEKGYTTVKRDFYDLISFWQEWYGGYVKAFHDYKVYNGSGFIQQKKLSLKMAKKVCEDWANLLMNERVIISINDKVTQNFVSEVFKDNAFWVRINEAQEKKAAFGTVAYIPYIDKVMVNKYTGKILNYGKIKINFVSAENIFPLSWDNIGIKECAFTSQYKINKRKYLYLQMHVLKNGLYVIKNEFFDITNGFLQPIDPKTIDKFKEVLPEVETNSQEKMFIIDRLNINNTDSDNPMGIAVFENAIDVLKEIDNIYDSYNNEFILGRKRIIVSSEAIRFENGTPVFDPNDIVFYTIPEDVSDTNKKIIEPIDMALRITEHQIGLQDNLNLLSAKCGFGERHYNFNNGNITTATQIISENSTLFRVLKKHEIILEDAIINLIKRIINLGIKALNYQLDLNAEITIDFDDSIIEDKAATKAQASLEYQQGLIDKVEYFVKVYNMSESAAIEKVKEMETRQKKQNDDVLLDKEEEED